MQCLCATCFFNSYLEPFWDIWFDDKHFRFHYTEKGYAFVQRGVKNPVKVYFRECKNCGTMVPYRVIGGMERLKKIGERREGK